MSLIRDDIARNYPGNRLLSGPLLVLNGHASISIASREVVRERIFTASHHPDDPEGLYTATLREMEPDEIQFEVQDLFSKDAAETRLHCPSAILHSHNTPVFRHFTRGEGGRIVRLHNDEEYANLLGLLNLRTAAIVHTFGPALKRLGIWKGLFEEWYAEQRIPLPMPVNMSAGARNAP